MWKTRESFRGGGKFCPQPDVETFYFFHRACERNFFTDFFHRLSFHISQGLWRNFGVKKSRSKTFHELSGQEKMGGKVRGGVYRQALILAVMVWMFSWMVLSPFFRATSTLRMA